MSTPEMTHDEWETRVVSADSGKRVLMRRCHYADGAVTEWTDAAVFDDWAIAHSAARRLNAMGKDWKPNTSTEAFQRTGLM